VHCCTRREHSTVEWTRDKVAVPNIVAPAPQLETTSRIKSSKRDVDFVQSDSRYRIDKRRSVN